MQPNCAQELLDLFLDIDRQEPVHTMSEILNPMWRYGKTEFCMDIAYTSSIKQNKWLVLNAIGE